MGTQTTSIELLLALLYDLDITSISVTEPWMQDAIRRGLAHTDPHIRELAIGAVAVVAPEMARELLLYAASEHVTWLARYARLVAEDTAVTA